MKFAESLSLEGDSRKAAEEICAGAEGMLGGLPADLAFLFFTREHADDIATITGEVRSRLGVRNLLGCTGESIIGGGREIEEGPALSLWAAALPGVEVESFQLRCEQTPDGFCFPMEPQGLLEEEIDGSAVILIGEPFSMPADTYLRRFNEDHPGTPVVGGMASGARMHGEHRILLDDQVFDEGAVGVRLSGAVRIRTVVSQGCRPVGKPLVVTDCDRNAILKLGGRGALQIVQELFASLPSEDRQLFQRAPHVGVVMNESQHEFGPGDFLIRNVVGVDPNREAVFVSDLMRRGQTVQFHVRDGEAASVDLAALLEAEIGRYPDGGPAGGLVFSCNGRGSRLFSEPDHDITKLRDHLGAIPISGFFAQGEMGPVGGRNHLYGFTASVALFSELG